MKKLLILCLAVLSLAACKKTRSAHPDWTYNSVMYEVNIRQFSPEGTFAGVEAQLPRLKELGVDILWLMPMYEIGTEGRKGTLGSYYAISDYKKVNPEFGTMEDFEHLVAAAHAQGFKVILDWVANQTAPDNVWMTEKPADFYERGLVRQGGYTVQHRVDFLGSIFTEKFGLELYDCFILRRYAGEKNGNRLGAKISFYATEQLTPYVKMNWFKNYGYAQSVGCLAWGDWQLSRKTAMDDNNNGNLLCIDAGFGFTLSTSLSGSIGGLFKINLTEGVDKDQKTFWSIPLCLTATF